MEQRGKEEGRRKKKEGKRRSKEGGGREEGIKEGKEVFVNK